ncbi:hypothetical protein CASFOL_021103 [Castilleja foliolosa]|uniref:TF-B3 domain-containing protein n=1 Tax=Castilleja foliolosa TaxID=1961234 RepID=A0ABD3CWT3_9LAMI
MATVPATVEAVWVAIAGPVNIPAPNRYVYFYPNGDIASRMSRSGILCRLVSVSELAYDRRSQQPVIDFFLQPLNEVGPAVPPMQAPALPAPPMQAPPPPPINAVEEPRVSCHVKVLTMTDVGGKQGLTLPVICSNDVFPVKLREDDDFRMITLTDPIGGDWVFKQKRTRDGQSLTTGWKNYLEGKNVVKDDEIVFKRINDSVFFGIRTKKMR